MADPNFFPGFEGDDEAPKAKPSPAPAKPAFNPFADVPPPATPAAPAKAPVRPAPAAASAPPPPADADAEIKPGARKDLWKCPHCGAGNKPDRSTCRTCGKSPSDPVVVPWHRNNLIRAGILAAVGLIIIVIVLATRTDLSLRQPLLANVDSKPRIAGSADGSVDLGNMRLQPESQISVCGRVAAVGRGPGGTVLIALALGSAAAAELPPASPTDDGGFDVDGVVLACTAEGEFAPKPGQILSLTGVTGALLQDGQAIRKPLGIIPVAISEFRAE